MLKIDRHTIDKEYVNRRIKAKEKILKTAEKVARTKPEKFPLSTLATDTLYYLSFLSALEPDSSKICPLLHATVQAYTAHFLQSLSVGEHIQVTIMGDVAITLSTTGSSSTTDTDSWLCGFFVAMVRRDTEALHVLAHIPLEIIRNSSTKSNEYVYLYVDVLQALWRNEKDLGTRLVNAVEATDPEKLERGVDYALAIVVPVINLLFQLLKNDVPQFHHVLSSALERHKKFWSVNEMRSRDPYGFIAWPLLAIACLAYEFKMPIEVESEYLPLRLLHGECRARGKKWEARRLQAPTSSQRDN
jgi:Immunity protein 49